MKTVSESVQMNESVEIFVTCPDCGGAVVFSCMELLCPICGHCFNAADTMEGRAKGQEETEDRQEWEI